MYEGGVSQKRAYAGILFRWRTKIAGSCTPGRWFEGERGGTSPLSIAKWPNTDPATSYLDQDLYLNDYILTVFFCFLSFFFFPLAFTAAQETHRPAARFANHSSANQICASPQALRFKSDMDEGRDGRQRSVDNTLAKPELLIKNGLSHFQFSPRQLKIIMTHIRDAGNAKSCSVKRRKLNSKEQEHLTGPLWVFIFPLSCLSCPPVYSTLKDIPCWHRLKKNVE